MNTENTLKAYTAAQQSLKDHLEANPEVFKMHEKLLMRVIDTENDLRDAVSLTLESIENGMYSVTVTPQTQRIYDEDIIKLKCPEAIKDIQRPARISISSKERTI